MTTSLQHVGILGMRWGQRKSNSSPGSSEHNRAMANRNPFRTTAKEYRYSRKRLSMEKTVQKIQGKKRYADKTEVQTMSDAEIKSFLRNPIMKKKLKSVNQEESIRARRAVVGIMALGYGAYIMSPLMSAGAKVVLQKAVDAKRARRVVKVSADVVDSYLHNPYLRLQ